VDDETRAYLDQALGGLRQEIGELRQEIGGLHQEVGGLHQDIGGLHQEIGGLHQEVGGLRQEVGGLRQEMRTSALETRRHFDVVAEDLRHDVRGVAEGVAATFERVDRLGGELHTEMDQRFAATHAVVRVAFRDVRLDISDLRSRL